MQFPEINSIEVKAYCRYLFVADTNSERCKLVALAALLGMTIGATTAAIIGWNITLCAAAGAFICVASVIGAGILLQPATAKPRQPTPVPVRDGDFESYLSKANAGAAQSQLQVGLRYRDGTGVEEDTELAIKYFTMVINNEKAKGDQINNAHYYLGEIYSKEPFKDQLAIEHLLKPNTRSAKKLLVEMYNKGRRIDEEAKKELKIQYYTVIADETKDAEAQLQLGSLYGCFIEQGEKKEHELAFKYTKAAVDQGYKKAIFWLGYLYEDGVGVAENKIEALNRYQQVMIDEKTPGKGTRAYNRLKAEINQ